VRDKIDLLEDKIQTVDKKVKIALFISMPLAIILLFYFLYVPNAIDKHQSNITLIMKLNHDLNKHSEKILLHKIVLIKQKILNCKSKISTDEQKLNYLDAKLSKSSFLFLSQKDFTLFLNNLLAKSVKNNFLLEDVKIGTKNIKYIGKLQYRKLIQISGTGEFLDTLKFIREVEENNMLLQIKKLNIETDGTTPHVTYDIDFYGIKK